MAKIYRFGDFELDTAKHQLRRVSAVNEVEPQVFRLLTLLIENRDRVVRKEEIIEKIWDGRIISDSALNTRVHSARAAIGDDGRTQRWIKTKHGVGFRFIGEVTIIEQTNEDIAKPRKPELTAVLVQSSNGSDPSVNLDKPNRRTGIFAGLAVVLTALAALIIAFVFPRLSPLETTQDIAPISVAVLPFEDFTGSDESAYLSLSLANRLLNRLSARPSLSVRSRLSSQAVAQRPDLTVQDIGDVLKVDYVLRGALNIEDDSLNLTSSLIDVKEDRIVWTKEFDRSTDPSSLLSIERNLADSLGESLGLEQDTNPVLEWETDSPLAYEAMALGDFFAAQLRSVDAMTAAIAAYSEAINADRDLAAAYASRATQYVLMAFTTEAVQEQETLIKPAQEDIKTALQLDPKDIRTQFAAALARSYFPDTLDSALKDLRSLLEQAPYHILTYEWLAYNGLLVDFAAVDTISLLQRGLELDPLNPRLLSSYAEVLYWMGRFDDALLIARRNYDWNVKDLRAVRSYALILEEKELYDEAYSVLKTEINLKTQDSWTTHTAMAWVYSLEGREAAEALGFTGMAELGLAAFSGETENAIEIATSMPDALDAAFYLPFLEASDDLSAILEPTGLLEAEPDSFRLDRQSQYPLLAQETLMEFLMVGMVLNEINHPNAEALSAAFSEDLDYVRRQPEVHSSFAFLAAGWLITEGRYEDAVDWLDFHSRVQRHPLSAFMGVELFDRIRDRADFKRVEAQYARNAQETLLQYQQRQTMGR